MSWHQQPLVAFDLETTGLNLETDSILTAAVSRVGAGLASEHRYWEMDPGVEIDPEAQELHGIDNQQRLRFPAIEEALPELLQHLEQQLQRSAALVVYNAPFDLTILDRAARRQGLTPLQERLPLLVIDPLVLDRAVDPWRPGSRRLTATAAAYGLAAPEQAHNANHDALVTARLAWKIGQCYDDYLNVSLPALHRQQARWARSWASSYQAHLRRQGKEETIADDWPWQPQPIEANNG